MDERQAREKLYDVMVKDAGFDVKVEQALELGEQYLDVDNAHLTEIHPEIDHWKAIASTDPPDGDFPAGQKLSLQTSYCRQVLANEDF